jgi:hypothetical protein
VNTCKTCHQPLPTLTIRGAHYRATRKTRIPKRYLDAGPDEVLYILPIPMLVVEPKKERTIPPKENQVETERNF